MFFWNSLAFSMIQQMLAISSLVLLFSKTSMNIWKFTVPILLKPGLKNFPQFIMITVKGFGIVNRAEIDVFLELSCFLLIQQVLAI